VLLGGSSIYRFKWRERCWGCRGVTANKIGMPSTSAAVELHLCCLPIHLHLYKKQQVHQVQPLRPEDSSASAKAGPPYKDSYTDWLSPVRFTVRSVEYLSQKFPPLFGRRRTALDSSVNQGGNSCFALFSLFFQLFVPLATIHLFHYEHLSPYGSGSWSGRL
jgi:hypothetical protein